MKELKNCPFCGGKAELHRFGSGRSLGSREQPTVIRDKWMVSCNHGCCKTAGFEDSIYHADSGEVVVEKNGAELAVEAWNRRASADIADNEPPIENKPEE